jgi:hypothetical protein
MDCLPGTYETRVFIGGNYDLMVALREVKSSVLGIGGFHPILPYDDFQIPKHQIYEWDLRLLHNCKHAIFDVTEPAGELFEIARCAEYGVRTLLVYQSRGVAKVPPRAQTMLLQSGCHEHRSYGTSGDLGNIVRQFLLEKNPAAWKRSVEVVGFCLGFYKVKTVIHSDGTAEHEWVCKQLGTQLPDFSLPQMPHDFRMTSGKIVDGTFKLKSTSNAQWRRDGSTSGERAEVGVVQFSPPLKQGDLIDYGFTVSTKDAYLLSRDDLSKLPIDEQGDIFLSAGMEFVTTEIRFPMEKLELEVVLPEGYPVDPRPVAYWGNEPRPDAIRMPTDSFIHVNNVSRLTVERPIFRYVYGIVWQIPEHWIAK